MLEAWANGRNFFSASTSARVPLHNAIAAFFFKNHMDATTSGIFRTLRGNENKSTQSRTSLGVPFYSTLLVKTLFFNSL